MNFITKLLKILLVLFSLSLVFCSSIGYAGVVNLGSYNELQGAGNFGGTTVSSKLSNIKVFALDTVVFVLSGLALVYMVYNGILMITSFGDDGKLKGAKKQLYYSMIAFMFINIPETIFSVFQGDKTSDLTNTTSGLRPFNDKGYTNIFVDYNKWASSYGASGVIGLLKMVIFGFAVLMFTMAGIKLITSHEAKARADTYRKIFYGVLALISVWMIDSITTISFSGDLAAGSMFFKNLINLSLYFAGPIAIFFLILGGFYYVTSGGDEEKAKKGKSIVINTLIAVILLIACYSFLIDLLKLNYSPDISGGVRTINDDVGY